MQLTSGQFDRYEDSILPGAVLVMIVWLLYLQLPVQSVPIATKVMSSNPAQWRDVLYTTLCD